jgi:hypothetical protein
MRERHLRPDVSHSWVQRYLPGAAYSWVQGNLQGWRSGIFRGFVLALIVLAINLGCTIGLLFKSETLESGQKIIYQGKCDKVKNLDIGVHLVINFLCTLLLGACNYAMQCISAPHERRGGSST